MLADFIRLVEKASASSVDLDEFLSQLQKICFGDARIFDQVCANLNMISSCLSNTEKLSSRDIVAKARRILDRIQAWKDLAEKVFSEIQTAQELAENSWYIKVPGDYRQLRSIEPKRQKEPEIEIGELLTDAASILKFHDELKSEIRKLSLAEKERQRKKIRKKMVARAKQKAEEERSK